MNSEDFKLSDDGEIEDLSNMEIAILIWDKQSALIEKYRPIEEFPEPPFNIDDPIHQVWIKDWFWRITEELTEFDEAIDHEEYDHAVEELSDVLHFFTGLFILLGHQEKYPKIFDWAIESEGPEEKASAYAIVYQLGLAGNCLKNKRWKQSPVRTNLEKFNYHLKVAFRGLLQLFAHMHVNQASDIYAVYFGKNRTNHERIKSNY